MIDRLLKLIAAPEPPDTVDAQDGRLALAVILVEAARADDVYDEAEVAQIDRVLVRSFGLSPFEAVALRREAEQVQAEAVDLVRFTRVLKRTVPHEDRAAVLESVWEVVLSDGVRDPDESVLLRRLAALLYVSDVDSGLARQRAAARLGGGAQTS